MYISKFQIINYKSFLKSEVVELDKGINVIAGANNSGKTAFLEALTLDFKSKPHITLRTKRSRDEQPTEASSINMWITISKNEIPEFIRINDTSWRLPIPRQSNFSYLRDPLLELVLSKDESTFCMRITNINQGFLCDTPRFVTTKVYIGDETAGPFLNYKIGKDSISHVLPGEHDYSEKAIDNSAQLVVQKIKKRIKYFSAQRFNIGKSNFGANSILRADAVNLPEVLSKLQANGTRFNRLNGLLNKIMPQIKGVSVDNVSNAQVEVKVWPHELNSERDDLALPLEECGTGISQVLAILYVLVTEDQPRIILIDEPQSFIHPGAVRKMMEIFKEYPQHQIIMTTHSPSVIGSASPRRIILVTQNEAESNLESLNAGHIEDQKRYLTEVGAKLSDVFGADNILWVEGATEERAFPLILMEVNKKPLMGTMIVGVKNTGDLAGKRAEVIFDIYDKLSAGASIIPPAVGFILDRECRTQQQMVDLVKRSGDKLKFLPRRMYENYLLNSRAICAVLNKVGDASSGKLAEKDVTDFIEEKKKNVSFYKPDSLPTNIEAEWKIKINGAKLLEEIFSGLSEGKCAYNKPVHGVDLTRWLINNAPDELNDISIILSEHFK